MPAIRDLPTKKFRVSRKTSKRGRLSCKAKYAERSRYDDRKYIKMISQKPVKLLILFCFLFFLGIALSFGLQPDYRQKIFSVLQQQGSPEPAQDSSREIFFSIQEKVKPTPEQARLEPVRQPESHLSGNGTAPDDQVPPNSGQKSGQETLDDEPGISDQHTDETALRSHPKEAQKKETEPAAARFAIQAVACRERANAEYLAEELRKRGYQATVYPDQHLDGSNWFKVRVGAYATREEAEEALQDYQKDTNPKAFTIKLDDIQSP